MSAIYTWLSNTPPEIGYVLFVLGIFLIWKSWSLKQNRNNKITASGSAVVITGSNSGPISTGASSNTSPSSPKSNASSQPITTGASSNTSPANNTSNTPSVESVYQVLGIIQILIGLAISIFPLIK
jgi:hypothetical protein